MVCLELWSQPACLWTRSKGPSATRLIKLIFEKTLKGPNLLVVGKNVARAETGSVEPGHDAGPDQMDQNSRSRPNPLTFLRKEGPESYPNSSVL